MPGTVRCKCALCHIEIRLLSEFARADRPDIAGLFAAFPNLQHYSSLGALLSHLKTSPSNSGTDDLLRELLALRKSHAAAVESFLVLVFLPLLHGTVHRVRQQQVALSTDDITQQALSIFLKFLGCKEFQSRDSYFAFAISRAVKRSMFHWAKLESARAALLSNANVESLEALPESESFERQTLLRHFLDRNVKKGTLAPAEVDLLIQFKLDGNSGEELASLNGSSSNAIRQKFKRLLAKLRRLAQ